MPDDRSPVDRDPFAALRCRAQLALTIAVRESQPIQGIAVTDFTRRAYGASQVRQHTKNCKPAKQMPAALAHLMPPKFFRTADCSSPILVLYRKPRCARISRAAGRAAVRRGGRSPKVSGESDLSGGDCKNASTFCAHRDEAREPKSALPAGG